LELLEKLNRTATNTNFTKPSKLELDLLQEQFRELYDELNILRNGTATVTINTAVENEKQKQEIVTNKPVINPNQNILLNEELQKEEPLKQLVVKHEDESPKKNKPVVEPVEDNIGIEITSEVKTPKTNPKSSINESTKSGSSLNEKHKPALKEVHKKLSAKPLKDLIDFNKKFALQNELFQGNATVFAEVISKIDSLTDYSSAEKFLNDWQVKNEWAEESQAARLFRKLVKQKFGEE